MNGNIFIVVPKDDLKFLYETRYCNKHNIKVVTYQYLEKLKSKTQNINYIIFDECHHLGDNIWRSNAEELIAKSPKVKVIGLTATPLRSDDIDVVSDFFNNCQVTPLDLVAGLYNGYLPKLKYVIGYSNLDEETLEKVNVADRYEISKLLNVENIFKQFITSEYLKSNLKILVFVPRIEDIKTGVAQCAAWFKSSFPNKAINTYYIHSSKSHSHNRRELNRFLATRNDDTIDIMVSVNKLLEGIHLPSIGVIIMLRKTKSKIVYFQQLGRCINNKYQPLIFDLMDNLDQFNEFNNIYSYNEQKLNDLDRTSDKNTTKDHLKLSDYIELYGEQVNQINKILAKYKIYHQSVSSYILDNVSRIKELAKTHSKAGVAHILNISYPAFITYTNKLPELINIEFYNKNKTDTEKIIRENIKNIKRDVQLGINGDELVKKYCKCSYATFKKYCNIYIPDTFITNIKDTKLRQLAYKNFEIEQQLVKLYTNSPSTDLEEFCYKYDCSLWRVKEILEHYNIEYDRKYLNLIDAKRTFIQNIEQVCRNPQNLSSDEMAKSIGISLANFENLILKFNIMGYNNINVGIKRSNLFKTIYNKLIK